MARLAFLLAALASRAGTQLSHLGGLLPLLFRFWPSGMVVGDVNTILGHDREARKSLARGRWR